MSFQNFYTSTFNKSIRGRTFVLLHLALIVFIALVSFVLNRIDLGVNDNDIIRNYQISKINNKRFLSKSTIFIGDSSCGNAINARYFNQQSGLNSTNLCLTGSWGIAGSLGILKKAYDKNPNLQNVIVIQTLDIWPRSYPYESILKLYPLKEIYEDVGLFSLVTYSLNPKVIWWHMKFIMARIIGYETIININSDYILQDKERFSNNLKVISAQSTLNGQKISADKLKELNNLQNFCLEKGLNCMYANGPIHKDVSDNSNKYLDHLDDILPNEFKIQYVDKVFAYDNSKMGDSYDHIDPEYKKLATDDYLEAFKPYLIFPKN